MKNCSGCPGVFLSKNAELHAEWRMKNSSLSHRAVSAGDRPRSCRPRFLPIPEQNKLHQHQVHGGTQHQEGMMASCATQIVHSSKGRHNRNVTNGEDEIIF